MGLHQTTNIARPALSSSSNRTSIFTLGSRTKQTSTMVSSRLALLSIVTIALATAAHGALRTEDTWSEADANTGQPAAATKSTVDFNHFLNDTPNPTANIEPASGIRQLQLGVDRYDGEKSGLPIFDWTFKDYVKSALNTDGLSLHHNEVWVISRGEAGGRSMDPRMVPDQMFLVGPDLDCQTATSAKTTVIRNVKEAAAYQASTLSMGYEDDSEQMIGVGKGDKDKDGYEVGAELTRTVEKNMEFGFSSESKNYNAASNAGRTRSAFTSTSAISFRSTLVDETSLSAYFVKAVQGLGQNPDLEQLREFVFLFGTNYITSAELGGRVSQQLSIGSETDSAITDTKLKEASGAAFNAFNVKIGKQDQTGTNQKLQEVEKSGAEHATAVFEGGIPQKDALAWCDSVDEYPAVVSFASKCITSLIKHMPQPSDGSKLDYEALTKKIKHFIFVTRKAEYDGCAAGQKYNKEIGACEGTPNCPAGTAKDKSVKVNAAILAAKWAKETDEERKAAQEKMSAAEIAASLRAMTKADRKGALAAMSAETKAAAVAAGSNEKFSPKCDKCLEGKFGDGEKCTKCEEGKYAKTTGATKCDTCAEGKSTNDDRTACPTLFGKYKYMSTAGKPIYAESFLKKWKAGCAVAKASPGASTWVNKGAMAAYWDCSDSTKSFELISMGGDKYKLKNGMFHLNLRDYYNKGFKYVAEWSNVASTTFTIDPDSNEITYTDAQEKKYYAVMDYYRTQNSFMSAMNCQGYLYCPIMAFYDPIPFRHCPGGSQYGDKCVDNGGSEHCKHNHCKYGNKHEGKLVSYK